MKKSNRQSSCRKHCILKDFVVVLGLMAASAQPAYAESWEDLARQGQEQSQWLQSVSIADAARLIVQALSENISEPLEFARTLFLYLLMAGTLCMLLEEKSRKSMESIPVLGISSCILPEVLNLIEQLAGQSERWNQFLFALIPILSGLIAAGGYTGTAMLFGGSFVGAAGLFSAMIQSILLPITKIYMAVSICSAAWGQKTLLRASDMLLHGIRLAFQATAFLLGLLLGAQSILSCNSDGLALKTGKFLLANSIPIVGQAASDAFGSVVAGLKAARGYLAFGAFYVLILDFLPILIHEILTLAAISCGLLLAQAMGLEKTARCLSSFEEGIRLLMAVVTSYFLLLFFATAYMVLIGG